MAPAMQSSHLWQLHGNFLVIASALLTLQDGSKAVATAALPSASHFCNAAAVSLPHILLSVTSQLLKMLRSVMSAAEDAEECHLMTTRLF